MKANREFRLLHGKGGRMPSRFAAPERFDQVEIVEVATMETVLLWDVPAREVPPLLRELRADMAQLDGEAFLAKWRER
jgi:hypothetical protein